MQSNQLMNEDDKPFWTRVLLIPFKGLRVVQDDDPTLFNKWYEVLELSSCLMPDFTTLLWNGKLDKEAIKDVLSFLEAALGVKRDRNLAVSAPHMYFMILLNVMFQESVEALHDVFEWVIKTVTRTSYELVFFSCILTNAK